MRGVSARIATNVVWLVIFGVGIVVLALLTFATGVLFDDTYEVSVPMPEAGGVLPDQEVTVLGRAVGQVEDVELTRDGVLLTLTIQDDYAVPRQPRVQVLRRSPIGEQAVDFQPVADDWQAAEPGTRIEPVEAIVPAEVPFLLERTVELFEAIDVDDVATVVHELAVALDDRGPTLKQLGRDTLALNRTLVDGIPEFERLIDSSESVLETLQRHRRSLADSFVNAADLTEILADEQPTIDRLLDTGLRTLEEADALVRDQRANLTCLTHDFQDVTDMLLGPSTLTGVNAGRYESKLDEAEMALVRAPFFFQEGYNIIAQYDPLTGAVWTRVLSVPPPEVGQAYPTKRDTPATQPGAACVSETFGVGVNAVRQSDPQPPDETSPGIDYAPLVAAEDGDQLPPPSPRDTAAPAPRHRGDLPATGGGLAVFTPLALATALWLRRRSR
jgi:virulence factor Mce-like protein